MTNASTIVNNQVAFGTVLQQNCDDEFGYLVEPYLVGPYLAGGVCAQMKTQADRLGSNVKHSQVKFLLYNTRKLRVLCDFPSRGVNGTNWNVLSGGTAGGDFGINNLNTDIVEQVYRSTSTTVQFTCDTQISQGAFIDTLAILNHNLTLGAQITVIGATDPGFTNVGLIVSLPASKFNTYYVAPSIPLTGFRYVKFQIFDPGNPAGHIQIGAIVFGSALIIQSEDMIDEVTLDTVHYSDKVKTEAFTNVANDRAIKRAITISFKNVAYTSGDYRNLHAMFEEDRTSQKCLWIPTPRYPARFATFGKMTTIPSETHNDLGENSDWVSFPIHVDEST